jgi:hypothetical protein
MKAKKKTAKNLVKSPTTQPIHSRLKTVEIRPKGAAVITLEPIEPGELVVRGSCLWPLKKRTNHSIQTGKNQHAYMDAPARLLNHSCDPNLGVRDNQLGGFDFIALKEIAAGEELTWDYETTEYESIAVPKCLCGSGRCRKQTVGFRYRADDLRSLYGQFIAGYLQKIK